jgi:uridine kinase
MVLKNKYFVICVSGIIACGKTSLIKKISELLNDAILLLWDDYDHLLKLDFDDRFKWMQEGPDFNKWRTEEFVEDIRSLLKGESIKHPISKKVIHPAKYIIIEDPTGRIRNVMSPIIDFLIFIDIPFEISLVRLINRELNNTQRWGDSDQMVKFFKQYMNDYLPFYYPMYKYVEERIRKDADLIVNGLQSVDEIAENVVSRLKDLL